MNFRNISLVASTFLPLLTWAQSGTYTLTGKVGAYPSAKVYLRRVSGSTMTVDSASMTNGTFRFVGKWILP